VKPYLIVAMSTDRAIGKDGHLPWRLPPDLKRFKELTMDDTVLMGRKTWESVKALPGRQIIVLSKTLDDTTRDLWNLKRASTIEEAYSLCETEVLWVAGGQQVYELCLPLVIKMYVTYIHELAVPDADAHFPKFDSDDWETESVERFDTFSYLTLKRIQF
jgi:dihydrofolate reductase